VEIDDVRERVQVLVKGDERDVQGLGGRRDEEVHGILGQEQANVKLGKRHHADRGLLWQKAGVVADQDRCIEEGSHLGAKGS